jgi:glycine cleavage system H protein
MYPEDLKYTAEHEWVRLPADTDGTGATVRVGITDYAQEALGDVVFVTLPAVGDEVRAGEPCGEIESTKSVSDIYAPVSGTIAAVNDTLESTPELLNSDAYGEGWMLEITPASPAELSDAEHLLDAQGYQDQLETG